MQRLLTEKQAGELLHWSTAAMRLNRRVGRGPSFYRVGKRVFYREADLERFVEDRRVEHTATARGQ